MELEALQANINGQVLTAESSGYDVARTPWILTVEQWPAVIVVAEQASDIVEAVRFAKENDLKIAVKNTGHGVGLPANDALLIVVSTMTDVQVNGEKQTAIVQAGAKWQHVLQKAQDFGLAPLLGSSSDVGAVGYTMGGGMGWLARKHGLSVDNVLSFDFVTADGELLHVSQEEHADLFWGLSGAGAAFGVVTQMEIKLFPVEKVYAGNLVYPANLVREVFTRYRDWIKDLDEDWTTSIAIENLPPFPDIPEEMRGKSFVMVRGCYLGPVEKGETMIQSWLDWKEPAENLFGVIPFRESDTISNDPVDPVPATERNFVIREISDEVIETLSRWSLPQDGPTPLLMTEIRHAGGAMARIDADAIAYSQHDAPFILGMIGLILSPEMDGMYTDLVNQIKAELGAFATGSVYLNFLTSEARWQQTKDGFSVETYERLVVLKKQYDPNNRFCFSLNIPFG